MSNAKFTNVLPVIFGCSGLQLTPDERAFFREVNPYGFILFARNCVTPDQVKTLVASLRDITGRDDTPVLIDQEGGRVARLKPPHWREHPPAGLLANLAGRSREEAREAVYLNARLIADMLNSLGINVNCAPLLDVPATNSHQIIGDRAFGDRVEIIVELGDAMAKGLMDGGVYPVIKHIPGHGRAMVDSHEELPTVDAPLSQLEAVDFVPFQKLAHLPYGMTAHVLYTALDKKDVATLSPTVIQLIREKIGFDGLLMSDDLSMKALGGSFADRTRRTLEAGCDLVLHCNGNMEEMQGIAGALTPFSTEAERRLRELQQLRLPVKPFDRAEAETRLNEAVAIARAA